MTLLALAVAGILFPIACLHLVWAFGKPWPFATEDQLARAVGGPALDPKISQGAKFVITILAAAAIAAAGLLPLVQTEVLPSPFPAPITFWLLVLQTIVFLLRGALGYTDLAPASIYEPFRTNNRHYYSPLILTLGAMCALILFL